MNDDMKPIPKRAPPEESELESMLSKIKPQPSQRFYKMMEASPWQKSMRGRIPPHRASWRPLRRLAWGLAVLLVILLVGSITLIPAVRAIARQVYFSFIAAPTNQIKVQVTLTSPADLFNYSDPANFPLSLEQAQSRSGFQVRQISSIPPGLVLIGARFDPYYNAVTQLYQGDHFSLFLTQRPPGNSQDVFSVGTQAVVEMVKIGSVQGEFVRGGWKAVSTQAATGAQTPASSVSITAVWDDSLPQSTLRWQADHMAFELRALGEGSPSQSELIQWANELK